MDNKSTGANIKYPAGPNIIIPVLLVISVTQAGLRAMFVTGGPQADGLKGEWPRSHIYQRRGRGPHTLRVTLLPLAALVLPPLP